MNIHVSKEERKTYFLNNKPGKFEILVSPFTIKDLHTKRPITLFQISLDILGIERYEIDYKKTYNSFHHWLKRWRKNNELNKKEDPPSSKENLSNFKFTDPSTLPSSKEPLIKIVK